VHLQKQLNGAKTVSKNFNPSTLPSKAYLFKQWPKDNDGSVHTSTKKLKVEQLAQQRQMHA